MGDQKKINNTSRRGFFSTLFAGNDKTNNAEKVKMLTPEGKLVEIDKNILNAATKNEKASNKEILDWMKNPSKENS